MNVEALTKLAELLDHIAELQNIAEKKMPKFDMSSWADVLEEEPKNLCGTSACACGHAALDPWFIEHGFTLGVYAEGGGNTGKWIALNGREDFLKYVKELGVGASWAIMYDDYVGFNAAQHFFKISSAQAERLFGGRLREPSEVADAVRLLMNDEEAFNEQFGIKDYDDLDDVEL